MRNILTIYQKEMRIYFLSPIAYIVIAMYLVLFGYFFTTIVGYYSYLSQRWQAQPYFDLNVTEQVFRPLFHNVSVTLIIILPMLTMRLFAEEKKTNTIELLFTYPLHDVEVILGKLLSCLSMFLIPVVISFIDVFLLNTFIKLEWGPILTGYLGIVLVGLSALSLGMFVSSLTENQIVAAIVTFGVLLLLWILEWMGETSGWKIGQVLREFSIMQHFDDFSKGVIHLKDLVFHLCFTFFFTFLTFINLGTKKWRG
jgi:ABC-2 type transport system permease protein